MAHDPPYALNYETYTIFFNSDEEKKKVSGKKILLEEAIAY